jgi:hypothetical protein
MPPPRNDIRNDIQPNPAATITRPQPAPPSRNDIRNDNGTATCPVCQTAFTPIRRQTYCTPACRQAAWRARHPHPAPQPPTVAAPRTTRRATTVYQCTECENRYLGQQGCHDCNKPCTRLDTGRLCPHCEEPVTISDLIGQPSATS